MKNLEVKQLSTEELNEILRKDAEQLDTEPDLDLLLPVMDELARRRKESQPNAKTASQAWLEFMKHYYPKDQG